MPHEERPQFIRPKWDFVFLYVGFAIAIFGVGLLWWFTPGLVITQVTPQGVWALIGWSFIAFGFMVFGAFAYFRWDTPTWQAGNKRWPQSKFSAHPLGLYAHSLNPDEILEDVHISQEEQRLAIENSPGVDGRGLRVELTASALGGIWAGGFATLPGPLGFVINVGRPTIQIGDLSRDEGLFTPRNLEPVSHLAISDKVLDQLAEHPKFVPGKSPIFMWGDLIPSFVDYLEEDNEVHQIVLRRLGIPRVAALMTNYAVRRFKADESENVRKLATDVRFLKEFTTAIQTYLSNSPEIRRVMALATAPGQRSITVAGALSLWRDAQRDANYQRARAEDAEEEARSYQLRNISNAQRQASIAGAEREMGPNYTTHGERAREPTD